MLRHETTERSKHLLDDEMNSQPMLCFSNFSVHTDVCANCFQFMLIDAKDKTKTRGEGTKITPKHINMPSVWNSALATCVEKTLRSIHK